jgi:hypothetical protein
MITVNDSIISGNILFVPDKSFFYLNLKMVLKIKYFFTMISHLKR